MREVVAESAQKRFCGLASRNEAGLLPDFSVIMPTYNRAFCIKRAIDSLLAQTYQDFELIVVDDGSTDQTEQLLAETYGAEIAAGRIRYLKKEKGGVCKARNAGLLVARGRWIAYLDSDNALAPEFLDSFKQLMSENPQAESFYCKLEFMGSKRVIGRAFDFDDLRFHNFIDLGTYVHKSELVKAEGPFDEQMTRLVDWELIVRYSKRHAPVFLDKILLYYDDSKQTNRITNLGSSSYFVNLNYLRRKHCADYPVVTTMVTTYKHEAFIAQALESAIAQEGRFIHEILVSDDASPDGTRAIVRAYAEKNPGLVYDISSDENLGISQNMRKCFNRASGKYIAVLEGDDFWKSRRKLELQSAFLEANADCQMVFSRLEVLENGKTRTLSKHNGLPSRLTAVDFFQAQDISLVANFSCCMFRRQALLGIPKMLFQNRLSEIALTFYMETLGPIGYIPEILSAYRVQSAGTWSGATPIQKLQQRLFCREAALAVCDPRYRCCFKYMIELIKTQIALQKANNKLAADCRELATARGECAAVKQAFAKEKAGILLAKKREVDGLNKRLSAGNHRVAILSKEVGALKKSASYRVGLFVTWPLRKVYRAFLALGR